MAEQIVCINTETGEVITGFELRWQGKVYDPNNFYLYTNVKGEKIRKENIGCYQKKISKQVSHPIFGDYTKFKTERRFTKIMKMPEFSKDQYNGFWMKVERAIERNTGAICLTYNNRKLKRISSVEEWMIFLDAGKNPTYEFIKETMNKTYIAKFTTGNIVCWIANPEYVWNGMMIPLSIRKLFNEKIK